MTDKEFDPYDFIDDDFIQAIVEVAEELERDTLTPLAEVRQEKKASR